MARADAARIRIMTLTLGNSHAPNRPDLIIDSDS
jgi:hypothetical protein